MSAELTKDPQLATPSDVISSVAWSPVDPDLIMMGCWNGSATLYNSTTQKVLSSFQHLAPVLDVCFSGAGDAAFSGGIDRQLRQLDLQSGQQTIIGSHDDAIRCVAWSATTNLLFSAGWDGKLKAWDVRNPGSPVQTAQLPAKAYTMDIVKDVLVLGCADRHVCLFDVQALAHGQTEPKEKRLSSLKFMTRALRLNPTADAYANTSIEGRVAVEFMDPSPEAQAKKYAFKVSRLSISSDGQFKSWQANSLDACHRASINGVDTVFPVNALAFHPLHGTFATGGGDGMAAIWDLSAKKRLRQLPKYPSSISCLSFNCDGTKLAIAGSSFLEEGTSKEGMQNALWIRDGVANECKPKSKA